MADGLEQAGGLTGPIRPAKTREAGAAAEESKAVVASSTGHPGDQWSSGSAR
jgi:hypothetical protein